MTMPIKAMVISTAPHHAPIGNLFLLRRNLCHLSRRPVDRPPPGSFFAPPRGRLAVFRRSATFQEDREGSQYASLLFKCS
jgi:hypothetical protein